MSHFSCVVLLPPQYVALLGASDEVEVRSAVDLLLAPYYEELEVEPYEVGCGCVEDSKPQPDCEECEGTGKTQSKFE